MNGNEHQQQLALAVFIFQLTHKIAAKLFQFSIDATDHIDKMYYCLESIESAIVAATQLGKNGKNEGKQNICFVSN